MKRIFNVYASLKNLTLVQEQCGHLLKAPTIRPRGMTLPPCLQNLSTSACLSGTPLGRCVYDARQAAPSSFHQCPLLHGKSQQLGHLLRW